MENRLVIRFSAPINQNSVSQLISVVENNLHSGVEVIKLLISSPGGEVQHGVSAYNFLKGIPAKIQTHNFGNIDSMATVIYCAGGERLCMPTARFLIHGVKFGSNGPVQFEEKQLDEVVMGLKNDRENIAKILSENCNKPQSQIEKMMFEGATLTPTAAKELGLVHKISEQLIEEDEKIIGIG
ncbi:ATP-dependent Clp protease proteolytic subunit [Patescibacteria group bacterium]|nr:ATP-dependent Clp protease proteolytic subunit [Patescibacteria group bacterium]